MNKKVSQQPKNGSTVDSQFRNVDQGTNPNAHISYKNWRTGAPPPGALREGAAGGKYQQLELFPNSHQSGKDWYKH